MTTKSERLAAAIVSDPRWAAVRARDASANGTFVYSVRSTGVYCRPSCAARAARPENIQFHPTAEDAERAGFRPCKRCRPDRPAEASPHAALIGELCRLIEQAEQPPSLEALARRAGLSPYYLHRIFKATVGVTPRQFADAHRRTRVHRELSRSSTVTEAIYGAGYNSSGRFYEQSGAVLGMTPKRYRAGGADTTIRFAVGECSLGSVLVAASERGVCSITLGDNPEMLVRELQDRFPRAQLVGAEPDFERLVARVVALVEAPDEAVDLPLDVRGTAFQQRVWQALRAIPPGTTVSYSEIAERIGAPRSVRAVAGAVASNVIAVAIPCHRVVHLDGSLSGYRWGVERKRALLEREAVAR
jgi:AraC family transcriptional regulator, regulatory protein of adaptative response / methylated-DNA-[protein]-cysteine methyltransferase